MKRVIVLFIFSFLLIPIYSSSQENIINNMDILLENNNLRFRVDKKTRKNNFFLRTTIHLNKYGFEMYEGILYLLDSNMSILLGYGIKQIYGDYDVQYVFYSSYCGDFNNLDVRIDYYSDFNFYYNTSTSLVYFVEDNLGFGFNSLGKDLGPRMEFKKSFDNSRIRLHFYFFKNQIFCGVKYSF